MGSGVIVTRAEPGTPSTVAVIWTGPPDRLALTTPLWLTEASSGALDDQLIARLVTTIPLPVRAVAVSCIVVPTGTVELPGSTATS
jgi:hypothetical protein